MAKTVDQNVLLDDDNLEKGFDEALEDLQKSLNPELSKSEDEKTKKSKVADEDEDEEEDEEYEDEDMEKSITDILAEDEEAAAAMDVEPFLLQLAKAIDESLQGVNSRIANVEKLTKSIGQMTVANAQLSKSMSDTVVSIGKEPVAPKSVTVMAKSRFGTEEDHVETSGADILIKSREWLADGKISLLDAGNIEGRVNKGLIGNVNDALDQKTMALLKEGVK